MTPSPFTEAKLWLIVAMARTPLANDLSKADPVWVVLRAVERDLAVGAATLLAICVLAGWVGGCAGRAQSRGEASCALEIDRDMIEIEGGRFEMGDLFEEGEETELPVHSVILDGYLLARHEITLRQFTEFVSETGYRTSAEATPNPARQEELMQKVMPFLQAGEEEAAAPYVEEFLTYAGCFWWSPEAGQFGFSPECSWRNPLFAQDETHPVIGLSWLDAAHFCNWLSGKANLPAAYDLPEGDLLDAKGEETTDLTSVRGFRLPSEAEWEYAARERGRRVRFGNGRDIARPSGFVFDASRGDLDYLQAGDASKGTRPGGSFPSNALGLYDMSGNAWEWCSDYLSAYSEGPWLNPHASEGRERVLRGGRWGGSAKEMRASARAPYGQTNRCNNAGFRVARSLVSRKVGWLPGHAR